MGCSEAHRLARGSRREKVASSQHHFRLKPELFSRPHSNLQIGHYPDLRERERFPSYSTFSDKTIHTFSSDLNQQQRGFQYNHIIFNKTQYSSEIEGSQFVVLSQATQRTVLIRTRASAEGERACFFKSNTDMKRTIGTWQRAKIKNKNIRSQAKSRDAGEE